MPDELLVPFGLIVALYIAYLQIRLWLSQRIIEALRRPATTERNSGSGLFTFLIIALLIAGAVFIALSSR